MLLRHTYLIRNQVGRRPLKEGYAAANANDGIATDELACLMSLVINEVQSSSVRKILRSQASKPAIPGCKRSFDFALCFPLLDFVPFFVNPGFFSQGQSQLYEISFII